MDEDRQNEVQEEPIVAARDASTHPWTVVVELVNAVVTNRAVLGPWWPIDEACTAPLVLHPVHDLDKLGRLGVLGTALVFLG